MKEPVTVQDFLLAIRKEAANDVSPNRAVLLLQKLSALLGTVTDDWITAEMAYNRSYQELTKKYEKVSEARANAKASDEYEQRLRKEGLLNVTKELMNSLKYVIKNKTLEKQESRYQQ